MSSVSSDSRDCGELLGMAAAAALAFSVRAAMALLYPSEIGDGHVYTAVAENIWRNGCVSLSDPASGQCIPHWGGNQLPGFPAFIAFFWAISGSWKLAPLIGQSLVGALVIFRLLGALRAVGVGRLSAMTCGAVLALSPATIPFSRLFWTEALSIAATIWVFAELLYSEARGRLSVPMVASALVAAIFVRIDGMILAVPVGLVAVRIHGWRAGAVRLLVLASLVALPLGAWSARSYTLGLGWTPSLRINPDKGTPDGFVAWTRSWMTNQYQLEAVNWPAIQLQYDAIVVPEDVFRSEDERLRIRSLLDRLRDHVGGPMPAAIADEFAVAARDRIAADPLRYWVLIPAQRSAWMWLNPLTALGWPDTVTPETKSAIKSAIHAGSPVDIYRAAVDDIGSLVSRGVSFAYRAALLLVFLWIGLGLARGRRFPGDTVVALVGAYALVRTIAFASTGGVESRYLVEAIPVLEVVAAVGFTELRARSYSAT